MRNNKNHLDRSSWYYFLMSRLWDYFIAEYC